MTDFRLFGELSKVEEQDDGTIKVFGIASSGARDDAGEIILPEAIKAALPDYLKWGAVREMHGPSAAGTAIEASVDEDGVTRFASHVVDEGAIKKVKSKVYKGFSVGGKVLARDPKDPSIITAIKLIEVSLVDRPCNPDAVINLWKADIASGQEQETMSDQPSNADVIAKAKELAEAAGKPGRHTEFVVKAREDLLAKAAQPDPADALEAAIEKVMAAPAEQGDEPAHVTPGLADLGKALPGLARTLEADPLAKGFYTVSALARVIDELVCIQCSTAWEAKDEADGSPVPAELAASIQALGATLVSMAQEEVAEAVADMAARGAELVVVVDDTDAVMALAAGLVDLVKTDAALMEKAGKRNAKADQARIQESHDHMAKLGAVCDKQNCARDDVAAGAVTGDLAKLQSLEERNAKLEGIVEKALPALEKLQAEVEVLKAQPVSPKTAGSVVALRPVSKADDANPGAVQQPASISDTDVQKYLDSLSEAERGHLLMKAAMQRPIAITR